MVHFKSLTLAANMTTQAQLMGSEQDFLNRVEDVNFRPIFITGPHRSGTTLLYRVLAASGSFNVTSVFHILNRQRLLQLHFTGQEQQARVELDRLFESRGVKGTELNMGAIDPDFLEEYCYAFDYPGRRPVLDEKNLPGFQLFCKKVQVVQDPARDLLLKNPFDAANFLRIREMFPQARFVFIYRHPAAVIDSQIRLLRYTFAERREYFAILMPRYNDLYNSPFKLALARFFYSGRFPFLLQQVSRNLSRACDYILENVDKLGSVAIGVTYPELCRDTNQVVRRVHEFLGVQEKTPQDYSKLIRTREPVLLPEVQDHLPWIEKRNAAYLKRFGL